MGRDELRRACERHGLFVGLCAEMPSLSWLDADRTKALEGIVNVVKEVLYDMKTTGETPPVALSEKKFSVSCVSGCLPGCTSAWRFRQPRRTPPSTSSF